MTRRFTASLTAVLVLATTTVAGASLDAAAAARHPRAGATPVGAGTRAAVIVQATTAGRAADAVRDLGGTVRRLLPIVDGVAASVPATRIAALAAAPGVRAVTPDEPLHVAGTTTPDGTNVSTIKPVATTEVGADQLNAAGVTGSGVRVALVDTGVAAVPDLAGRVVPVQSPTDPNQTVDCVNFSGESTCNDSYGHGTFMAGLIAGSGAASGGLYHGAAPGAQLVSIKIAGADGSADVTKVLAAIQWAVSFKDTYNIKVLNLSLGTDSTASYKHDPLNLGVERAWQAGLTVVVAASNRGPDPQTISKPGDDPFVITVGAVDDRETPSLSDDRLPLFSGRGPTAGDGLPKPDVVAPGGRVISLRSPGSTVEQIAPGGGIDATYRRGSGTSMATAIVSGVAALLTQAHPGWTPDNIKAALATTAHKVADRDPMAIGAGLVDGYAAAQLADPGVANQGLTMSDGTAPLDSSRGHVIVRGRPCLPGTAALDPDCDVLTGQYTAQGNGFSNSAYATDPWTGSSWYSSQWTTRQAGSSWYGSSWYGSSWYGSSWYGSSWYGSSWYGSFDDTAYGASLAGSSWYGAWQ